MHWFKIDHNCTVISHHDWQLGNCPFFKKGQRIQEKMTDAWCLVLSAPEIQKSRHNMDLVARHSCRKNNFDSGLDRHIEPKRKNLSFDRTCWLAYTYLAFTETENCLDFHISHKKYVWGHSNKSKLPNTRCRVVYLLHTF